MIEATKEFPENKALERASWGQVPRVNISVKISSLYSQIDPIDPLGSIEALKTRLRPLYRKAKAHGAFINMDMEHYAVKDLTIMLFQSLMSEDEFVDYPHVGMVIQAYLRDAEQDAAKMAAWAKRRGTPVTVRLVKGAYWDYETIHAEQEGWPAPVFQKKMGNRRLLRALHQGAARCLAAYPPGRCLAQRALAGVCRGPRPGQGHRPHRTWRSRCCTAWPSP